MGGTGPDAADEEGIGGGSGEESEERVECWGPEGEVMWNWDMVGVASLSVLLVLPSVDEAVLSAVPPLPLVLPAPAAVADAVAAVAEADEARVGSAEANDVGPENVADTSMDGGGAWRRNGLCWSSSKRVPFNVR